MPNYKQVGRNCLADFLGSDPHGVAEMAQMLASFDAFASDCEDADFGNSNRPMWSLDEYLQHVAVMIRKNGWLSKGKAWEQGCVEQATANLAWNNMIDSNSNDAKVRDEAEKVEEKDAEVAAKTINFLNSFFDMEEAAVTALTDYEHNLRVAFLSSVVESKSAGILASAINYAAREQEKKAERVDFSNSQYVGTIGQRAIFNLKCVFPGFGGRPVVFVDEAGNKVSAWNPGFVVEKNGVYTVKATPVKQDEYKGLKSTMLNRMVLATEKDLAPKAPRKPRAKKVVEAPQVA